MWCENILLKSWLSARTTSWWLFIVRHKFWLYRTCGKTLFRTLRIWIWSIQRFIRYRAHKLFRRYFFRMSSVSHLDLYWFSPKDNQIIRNTQRTTNQIWMWFSQRLIRYCTHKLFGKPFFKISPVDHLVFKELFPKVDQIIRYNQRTTTSNINVIKPIVYNISRPQAFRESIFSKFPPSVLFLMDSSQKLIRSDITSEQPVTTANLIVIHQTIYNHKLF